MKPDYLNLSNTNISVINPAFWRMQFLLPVMRPDFTLPICIQEFPGSNLDLKAGCVDRFFCGLPNPP
jgi:hypothetical protein